MPTGGNEFEPITPIERDPANLAPPRAESKRTPQVPEGAGHHAREDIDGEVHDYGACTVSPPSISRVTIELPEVATVARTQLLLRPGWAVPL